MTAPLDRIDTSKAPRRPVRFESAAEALADAAALCEAHRRNTLTRTGNWTLGQALNHVASWMTFPFVGFPLTAPEELIVRARARKPRALSEGLMSGVHLPGVEGGTAAFDDVHPDQGLTALRASWERIQRETPVHPHPVFGPMSHEEWLLLQLRHSELHQSFFFPDSVPSATRTA